MNNSRAMKCLCVLAAMFLASSPVPAQTPTRPKAASQDDRHGQTCAQILKSTSSDWVANYSHPQTTDEDLRAIAAYGKCYDARTDRLAAALAKSGKGPRATALKDFRGFDQALRDFTVKALAANPPKDAEGAAYAALYQKYFRYEFYEDYEQTVKPPVPAKPTLPAAKSPTPAATTASTSPGAPAAPGEPTAAPSASAKAPTEPMTLAKNRFGELLGMLPDDKMHELHAAFGEILGPRAVSEETKLAVYRYAISLLERPSDKPFSPPLF